MLEEIRSLEDTVPVDFDNHKAEAFTRMFLEPFESAKPWRVLRRQRGQNRVMKRPDQRINDHDGDGWLDNGPMDIRRQQKAQLIARPDDVHKLFNWRCSVIRSSR
jgi:hypothetical protein